MTFIPALIFILRPPFNRNSFVRFHSFQCLLLWAVAIVVAIVLKLFSYLLFLFTALVAGIVLVGALVLWLVLLLKAFLGEEFSLPYIGDLAGQFAESSRP